MEPRSDGITKGSISFGIEVFELDMTEYLDVSRVMQPFSSLYFTRFKHFKIYFF